MKTNLQLNVFKHFLYRIRNSPGYSVFNEHLEKVKPYKQYK